MNDHSPKQQEQQTAIARGKVVDQQEVSAEKKEATNEDYMEVTSLLVDRIPRR